MIKQLFTTISILTMTVTAYATPVSPGKCPGVGSIHAAGLNPNAVERDANGLWAVAMMKNKYDTNALWTFVVGNIMASDAADAYRKATASLTSLNFEKGPYPVPQIGRWACAYSTAAGYPSRAVTPAL
ncbi:MAG TPA: hypothetical protein VL360_00660 [Gammaproteobacteria bacterium]|nr:hypothetical protein [Gammaproteobacteria bacterium]